MAGWLIFVISWGPSLAFGVFQEFYQTNYLADYSASRISWICGIQAFLLSTGAVCGPLFARGYYLPSEWFMHELPERKVPLIPPPMNGDAHDEIAGSYKN